MALIDNVQSFLKNKLEKTNLKSKILAQKIQIPYPTFNKLINVVQLNPELVTLIKIAQYFNCTIDEIIGRVDYYIATQDYKFNDISLEQINLNLRNFIASKLQQYNLNPYKLGRKIGFSEHPIAEFIQENSQRKRLSTAVIVALADYFKISIDEMIGRISPQNHEESKDKMALEID